MKNLFFALFFLVFSTTVWAERPSLMGGIDIEDVEEKSADSYALTRDNAVKLVRELEALLKGFAEGGSPAINQITMSEGVQKYFAATYLHCVVMQGKCPALLDAVLETDFINSVKQNQVICKNMRGFWKRWIDNDMERRQDHLVPIGYMNDIDQFKKKNRTRYLKCEDTITSELGSTLSSEVLAKRYAKDAPILKAVTQANELLTAINAKVPNVFSATGTAVKPVDKSKKDSKSGNQGVKKTLNH